MMQALGGRTPEQIDIEQSEKMRLPLWRVDLRFHDLHGLDLSRAVFIDARFDSALLTDTILADANCWDANFSEAPLWGVDFSGALLCGADLTKSDLSSANLAGARLSSGLFLDLSFDELDLFMYRGSSSLIGANLTDATLFGANLENANLKGANLAGAKFYEDARVEDIPVHTPAYGLTQKQLDSAIADPPDRPPVLDGMLDAKTGEPLVWKTDRQNP